MDGERLPEALDFLPAVKRSIGDWEAPPCPGVKCASRAVEHHAALALPRTPRAGARRSAEALELDPEHGRLWIYDAEETRQNATSALVHWYTKPLAPKLDSAVKALRGWRWLADRSAG